MIWIRGTKTLFGSSNGVLAMLILAVTALLCCFGKIDGTAFKDVMCVVATIYTFVRAAGAHLPMPPQPPIFPPQGPQQ